MRFRVDTHGLDLSAPLTGQRIDLDDLLDFIVEEADAPGAVLQVGWPDVQRVATEAEASSVEEIVVSSVLESDEFPQRLPGFDALTTMDIEPHRRVCLDGADAVDAGNGSHDEHVIALHECASRRMAHSVDLLVDLGFLLNVGVCTGNIRFGW